MSRVDRIRTEDAIAKSAAANKEAWADPQSRATRLQAMKRNHKKPPRIQGRAVGAIGPGDVRKLADAGLTVVDATAYEAMCAEMERLRAALEEQ